MPEPSLIVAVDIGATWIRTALVDGRGALHAKRATRTPRDGAPDALLAPLLGLVDALRAETPSRVPTAIGVAAMGPVDAGTGRLAGKPPNLGEGWRDLPLGAALADRYALPVVVERDTNVAALGERAFGAARGAEDVVYLTVSTGVGGAVLAGGRLLRGARGFAGELGHLPVDVSGGPDCACGLRGCIEAIASGTALGAQARRLGLGDDAVALTAAAEQGHEQARAALDRARAAFAAFAAGLVNAFDPELVVVGGAVAHAEGERLLAPARAAIDAYTLAHDHQAVRVLPAALGGDSGLIGCWPLVAGRRPPA